MRILRIALAVSAFAAVASASHPAAYAQSQTVTTEYGMALLGLIVGKASFDTVMTDNSFSVKGNLSSAGLGRLVSHTGGTSRVSGRVTNSGFLPERYGLDYTSDGKHWQSDVHFRSGRVTFTKVSPKRSKNEKPSYIPVETAQLRSVVDPLSGLMIRTHDPASVCRRTLPLYDGWSRLDLRLSPNGTETVALEGYSGEAAVCNVRIQPVSGYDKSSKGLKFLESRTIEVWFAPIARPDVYVPVYASVPTTIGSLILQATSVSVK
ncbi:DUF3108 domain-containing protein [Jiella sp. MQZ9-1]|uniref:DUF3108 domain-containing protein n=1 Tax=Jiella flava TaxID=2816857 RepID=A0A939G079_9HYPH|nr:DUF3108 domain-containing protein [Jiella flava]MBO0662639.1 DUF3108 domain-containing protein [Jiella flava]MCD2471061.1 DUF3108 domain-containing protein [Jiella flava]